MNSKESPSVQLFRPQAVASEDMFAIERKPGVPLCSADGELVLLPSKALANAVAAEWEAAGPRANPTVLPLARLAVGTAELRRDRTGVEVAVSAYAETDLLCYRAGSDEADLVVQQDRVWSPLLAWAAGRIGAHLEVTVGIMPHPQPLSTLSAVARVVSACKDYELVALRAAAASTGSLVIALALLEGEVTPRKAWEAAYLDEHVQAKRWGVDAEAEKAHIVSLEDLEAVAEFVCLARQS